MRRNRCTFMAVLILLALSMLNPVRVSAATQHSGIAWQGTQTCLSCHQSEALDVHGSSHYQWQGPATYTVNGPDVQGKMSTAFNSYCISILGNWNACGSCHVGLGAKPDPVATDAQVKNIDCLVCHQKDYKRVKVNGLFVPDTAKMTVTMDQAVQSVHLPTRSTCLQCHAKGGGGDNNKRGDLSIAHGGTTDRNFDVHMATTGANLACQQCHTTQRHRIAGRGSDLRETDLDVKMSCSTSACHTEKSTATGHQTKDVNRHISRVACQTCHIASYARNAVDTAADESTEVYRDWRTAEFNTALNRYEPTITRGSNLKPVYRFWNGLSWNYSLNELALLDTAAGTYATSRPEGAINDAMSKLYPFKYKRALQPYSDTLGLLVALDTSVYFSSGIYEAAVKTGLTNMGQPNTTPYRDVETDTYQLITHEVMPKGNALTCNQCHTSSATQMKLGEMGYAMKGTQATTCSQCHEQKSLPGYASLHNKHVTEKRYDCSWCHTFSRPERGLKTDPGADTQAPVMTAFSVPATSASLTISITTLTATDNVNVVGYLITENPTKPSASAAGWSTTKPTSYTLATGGAKTLYAWAKDGAGNISAALPATVTVTVSSTGVPNIVTASALDFGQVRVGETTRKTLEIRNTGTARLNVTRVEVAGSDLASSFRTTISSFTINGLASYQLVIEFRPRSVRPYSATLRIYSNDPDTPVNQVVLSGTGIARHTDR